MNLFQFVVFVSVQLGAHLSSRPHLDEMQAGMAEAMFASTLVMIAVMTFKADLKSPGVMLRAAAIAALSGLSAAVYFDGFAKDHALYYLGALALFAPMKDLDGTWRWCWQMLLIYAFVSPFAFAALATNLMAFSGRVLKCTAVGTASFVWWLCKVTVGRLAWECVLLLVWIASPVLEKMRPVRAVRMARHMRVLEAQNRAWRQEHAVPELLSAA